MKKVLHFSLFVFSFSLINAQTWQPVSGGVYGGDTSYNYPVRSLCVYNKRLYAGGAFEHAGKLKANHIAAWDGIKWQDVGGGTDDFVESLYVYNNMLCVGGGFSEAGNAPAHCLAVWADTNKATQGWQQMGNGMERPGIKTIVPGFTECNGALYILVNQPHDILSSGGLSQYMNILKWNKGQNIQSVGKRVSQDENLDAMAYSKRGYPDGSALPGFRKGGLTAIVKYKDKLCATGPYNRNAHQWFPAVGEWDGHTMNFIGNDTISDDLLVYPLCMLVDDSNLYVGGDLGGHTSSYVIKWNGKNWTRVGKWQNKVSIHCMVKYKGKLYAGGEFDSICNKPANGIACWDGNNWEPVGAGFILNQKNKKAIVKSLCVYKSELYAAGQFSSSGGKPVLNIAKLDLGENKATKKK